MIPHDTVGMVSFFAVTLGMVGLFASMWASRSRAKLVTRILMGIGALGSILALFLDASFDSKLVAISFE
jgi:hypothetical protein